MMNVTKIQTMPNNADLKNNVGSLSFSKCLYMKKKIRVGMLRLITNVSMNMNPRGSSNPKNPTPCSTRMLTDKINPALYSVGFASTTSSLIAG